MSGPDGSVFIPVEDLNSSGRIFNGRLTYRKGAALVHMIRFEMQNDSLFFRTLYNYQQQYKDSVAIRNRQDSFLMTVQLCKRMVFQIFNSTIL